MISENQAYLAGISEDAYIEVNTKRGYEFDLETKSKRWAEIIARKFSKESERVTKTQRGKYTRVRTWSKKLVTKLYNIKNNSSLILSEDENVQTGWLTGFVDAEGTITKTGSNQPMISIYNKDRVKLRTLEKIMNKNQIHIGYYKPNNRDVWQQFITGRKNIIRFVKSYDLNHPDKRQKLINLLDPKQSENVG